MDCLALCLFALLAAGQSHSANIRPYEYNVDMLVDTEIDEFSGFMEIIAAGVDGKVDFELHNSGLQISLVTVTQNGNNMFNSMSHDQVSQTTKISLSEGFSGPSNVTITISYQGNVSTNEATGLYSFLDSGKKVYMTNFYPIYARKVFPCLDEPAAAATFNFKLKFSSVSGQLIASVPVTQAADKDGKTVFKLKFSTPVAPYSVFFTLGLWSNQYQLSNKFTVWLLPSLSTKTNLIDANLVTAANDQYITGLMNLFKIQNINVFISPVLQQDSYSGFGSVVLNSKIAINDLRETTTAQQKEHFVKMSYAFYKVFYGTEKRPSNWGNNWLSDSICIYLAHQNIQNVPQFGNPDDTWVSGLSQQVLRSSSSDSSAVPYTTISPTDPKDIIKFLDGSGANKGAYVLKSLESFMSSKQVRSALLAFLIMNHTPNTMITMDTDQFLDYLQMFIIPNISGLSIQTVLKPMISNPGYPLIQVQRDDMTLAVQKLPISSLSNTLNDVSDWLVPVSMISSRSPNNTSTYFLPSGVNSLMSLDGVFTISEWALLNVDGKGMMRVNYDADSWYLFYTNVSSGYSSATRAQLIADAFANAESNILNWEIALSFLVGLERETALAPWKNALDGFRRMRTWIYHTGSSKNVDHNQLNMTELLQDYVLDKLNKVYSIVGNVGENADPLDPLRREIVSAACEFGNSTCVSTMTEQYNLFITGAQTPSNNMYSVVLCNGLRNASEQDWMKQYNAYVNGGKEYSQELKDSHYSFLACSGSDAIINKFMGFVLLNTTLENFPSDQVLPAMKAIIDKPENVDNVLSFLIQNLTSPLVYTTTNATRAAIFRELGKRLTSSEQINVLSQYVEKSKDVLDPMIVSAINEAVSFGKKNVNWIYQCQSDVQKGLQINTPTPPTAAPTDTPSTFTPPPEPDTTTHSKGYTLVSSSIFPLIISAFYVALGRS